MLCNSNLDKINFMSALPWYPSQNRSPENWIVTVCQRHPGNGNAGAIEPIGTIFSIGRITFSISTDPDCVL